MIQPPNAPPPGSYDFYVTKRGGVWRTKVRNGDEQYWIPLKNSWLAQALRDYTIGKGIKLDHGVSIPEISDYLRGMTLHTQFAYEGLNRIMQEHRRQ